MNADVARPGFWLGHDTAIELCDGRLFTQTQTNIVIEFQLWFHFGWAKDSDSDAARQEILGPSLGKRGGLFAPEYMREFPESEGYIYAPWAPGNPGRRPTTQRGGIHTRAPVRWLARAAWGDRDLKWRELAVDEFAVRASLLELD